MKKKKNTNENYTKLVEELCKDKPNTEVLKNLCSLAGFSFSDNLIELMSDVLIYNQSHKVIKSKSNRTRNAGPYEK